MPDKVFISYSSIKDLDGTVSQFHKYLQNEIQVNTDPSVTVFFDKEGIRDGSNWSGSLSTALQECKVMVILLSPSWLHSEWCKKEYVYFKSTQEPYNQKAIIPLRWANTTLADASTPEEKEIIKELSEIQQVNWLQLKYERDYEKSVPLARAVGELSVSISDYIKGFTLLIKYPFGFEEKAKPDEKRPVILARRIQQANILLSSIPAWLMAENEFNAVSNTPTDEELNKIRYGLPSFMMMTIHDSFSPEFFRTNYPDLPEVEAMLSGFRLKAQAFQKELEETIKANDKLIGIAWGSKLKNDLLQMRLDVFKISEEARKIFDASITALQ